MPQQRQLQCPCGRHARTTPGLPRRDAVSVSRERDGGRHHRPRVRSRRLTPSRRRWEHGKRRQTDGLGEGWSDYFAISFFNDPVIFEYSGGGDATTPPTSGFRRITSYATSTEKYTLLCNPSCEEHNDGEIWATALWNLRVKLGQATTDQLVVNGMKGTATNPSFLTAKDAILTAATSTDQCRIWGVFAASEMGSRPRPRPTRRPSRRAPTDLRSARRSRASAARIR